MMLWFGSLAAALYLVVLLIIRLGWNRLPKGYGKNTRQPSVNIVMAARNEAQQLPQLLTALTLQTYPQKKIEVILVDDHSEDGTREVANAFREKLNLKILSLGESKGKMAALEYAGAHISQELVIFTDADVVPSPGWIARLVDASRGADWVSGLVAIDMDGSLLSTFQAYDMAGMQAITAASFALGMPGLANGANMLIRRQAFLQTSRFHGPSYTGSGDDVFLLEEVARKSSTTVRFQPSADTIVRTDPKKSITAFLSQRQRWASKSIYIKNPFIWLVMVTGVWANLWVIVLLVGAFFNAAALGWLASILLLKILMEGMAIWPILRQTGQLKRFWGRHLLVAMCYPFYIISAAFLGIFVPYHWKGRKGKWRN